MPEIEESFRDYFKNKDREKKGSFHVPIGGIMKLEDVFEVPIELPRYRLDNTRTLSYQQKYLSDNQLGSDYFNDDIWLDKLQAVQHEILKQLIDRKNLKDYFASNVQTDPLILTHDGFVISGNRRLCTMRELYFNSPKGHEKYRNFERVRVVILPKCTEEEIEYIEDFLEQQQDIKDEFTWINKALGFKRRLDKHGYNSAVLAEKSGFKKSDIDSYLQQLNIAQSFLEDIGKPDNYDLIEKDNFAFIEIEKGRKALKNNSSKKDLFQKLSFVVLKNQDKITGRMYSNIPLIQQNLLEIEEEIKLEFADRLAEVKANNVDFNLFDDNTLFPDNTIDTLRLLEIPDIQDEVFEIIKDKLSEVKNLKEETNRKKQVLKKVKEAATALTEANNIRTSESDKAGILTQIANIEKVLVQLKEWASK